MFTLYQLAASISSAQVGNYNTLAIHGGAGGGAPVCAPLFVPQSHLDLHTPNNPWIRFDYGACPTGAPGRPAGKIGFASNPGFLTGLSEINDFLFVNNDSANHIRLANNTAGKNFCLDLTMQPGTQVSRLIAYADGKFDFKVGNWNCNTGMIRFDADVWDGVSSGVDDPVIKLYRPTGTDAECPYPSSYAWFIQNSGNGFGPDYTGALQFRSKEAPSIIGTETGLQAKVTFLRNGNVGINTTTPIAKLHVLDGAVLFNGTTGSTPTGGPGARFMWIPEKYAMRAGYAGPTSWNDANIGEYSWAGGINTISRGLGSFAIGDGVQVLSEYSAGFGRNTVLDASATYSLIFGKSCTALAEASLTGGFECHSVAAYDVCLGQNNESGSTSVIDSHGNISIGHNCKATSIDAIALGFGAEATGEYSSSIGREVDATADYARAIGTYIDNSGEGAILIGNGIDGTDRFSNSDDNVFMIGMKSDVATLTVTPASGASGSLGDVGIGTSTPQNRLDVNGSVSIGYNSGTYGAPTGTSLLVKEKVGIGTVAPEETLSVIGAGATIIVANDNSFVVADGEVSLAVEEKVIIGTNVVLDNDDDFLLHVDGDAFKTGSGGAVWNVASDERYKKNISDYTEGLSILKQIRPVWFEYNGKMGVSSTKPQVGVIAQEMRRIVPHTISEGNMKRKVLVKAENRYEVDDVDTVVKKVTDYSQKDEYGHFRKKDSTIYKPVKRLVVEPAEWVTETEELLSYNPNALWYLIINSVKELDSVSLELKNTQQETTYQLNRVVEEQESINDSLRIVIAGLQDRIARLEAIENIAPEDALDVILEQNNPNPFATSSTITYYIPESVAGTPQLVITASSHAQILEAIDLQKGMPNQLTISAQEYETGVFVYSIVVGNKVLVSKKFIIIK